MAAEAKPAFSSPLLAPKTSGIALVTGCSEGGIGHALAMELAARRFHVIATSRSASTIAKSLQELPNVDVMDLDVSSLDSIALAVSSIIQKHGRIDILINNAGVPCHAPTAEIPLSLLESTFKTNVFGPIALIEAVVPYMVEAGQGKIVNIGSIGGFIAGPWVGAYSASKSALHALTDSLSSGGPHSASTKTAPLCIWLWQTRFANSNSAWTPPRAPLLSTGGREGKEAPKGLHV